MKKVLATVLALVMALGVTTISWATQPQNDGSEAHPYTLTEFNNLTEIPADTTDVYVNIGDVSLADGDVTIGNQNICDIWTWDKDTSHKVGDILEDGRKVYMVRDNDTIYSSNKPGIFQFFSCFFKIFVRSPIYLYSIH